MAVCFAAACAAFVPFGRAAGQAPAKAALAGTFTAGPFRLALDTLGTYRVLESGVVAVEGVYELRADTLVVRDTAGPLACPPEAAGSYVWILRAGKLTLRTIADVCLERGAGLAREWAAVAGAAGHGSAAASAPIRAASGPRQGTR